MLCFFTGSIQYILAPFDSESKIKQCAIYTINRFRDTDNGQLLFSFYMEFKTKHVDVTIHVFKYNWNQERTNPHVSFKILYVLSENDS